jgi:hypothetical protein
LAELDSYFSANQVFKGISSFLFPSRI